MSAHELCVLWPAYFRVKGWLQERLQELEGTVSPEQFDEEHARMTGGGG